MRLEMRQRASQSSIVAAGGTHASVIDTDCPLANSRSPISTSSASRRNSFARNCPPQGPWSTTTTPTKQLAIRHSEALRNPCSCRCGLRCSLSSSPTGHGRFTVMPNDRTSGESCCQRCQQRGDRRNSHFKLLQQAPVGRGLFFAGGQNLA